MNIKAGLLAIGFSLPAMALDPPEDFGIKLVPPFMGERVVANCQYLDEVATRSLWGGMVAGSLGKKGVMKRLYKKAHKLGATHLVLVESSSTAYSGFTEGSAHAFNCRNLGLEGEGFSTEEAVELKTAQREAEAAAGNNLRAVTQETAKGCEFLKSVSAGAGGTGDPSIHAEVAMEKALTQAAAAGANSYSVINLDTTASGASVVLEALKCS